MGERGDTETSVGDKSKLAILRTWFFFIAAVFIENIQYSSGAVTTLIELMQQFISKFHFIVIQIGNN